MEILVVREMCAQLRENEWYIADLVGLELVSPDGRVDYGRVHAICGGGPDPWLEVDRPDGSRALVPFRKEFIGEVDLPGNRLFLLSPWVLE
jgi:16S rRNA processing protein RimM